MLLYETDLHRAIHPQSPRKLEMLPSSAQASPKRSEDERGKGKLIQIGSKALEDKFTDRLLK